MHFRSRSVLFAALVVSPAAAAAAQTPGERVFYPAIAIIAGSSMYSLILTRNCTASRPSTMRWS